MHLSALPLLSRYLGPRTAMPPFNVAKMILDSCLWTQPAVLIVRSLTAVEKSPLLTSGTSRLSSDSACLELSRQARAPGASGRIILSRTSSSQMVTERSVFDPASPNRSSASVEEMYALDCVHRLGDRATCGVIARQCVEHTIRIMSVIS